MDMADVMMFLHPDVLVVLAISIFIAVITGSLWAFRALKRALGIRDNGRIFIGITF